VRGNSKKAEEKVLLSAAGEELGLDNYSLGGESAATENLVETSASDIDHGHLVLGTSLGVLGASLLRDESPQPADIHARAVVLVLLVVEVTHTNLAKVARVIFVKIETVVPQTTNVTATRRMFTVLTDATETNGDMTTFLAVLAETGRHV